MKFFSIFILVVLFSGCNKKHKQIHEKNTTDTNITKIKINTSEKNISKKIEKPEKKLPPLQKVIETVIQNDKNIKNIIIKDLIFIKKNDKLYFSFKHTKILLFLNDSTYSKLELKEIKKLKKNFYIIKNKDLIDFFNITKYPSIVILKQKTAKKYEGFMPYEVLKYELKD